MWISKRKWTEMEDRMDILLHRDAVIFGRLETLKDELTELEKAHKDEIYTYVDGNRCTRTKRKYSHKTSTNTIKDITLEELARFVIDHEPIVREENVKVKVEYR